MLKRGSQAVGCGIVTLAFVSASLFCGSKALTEFNAESLVNSFKIENNKANETLSRTFDDKANKDNTEAIVFGLGSLMFLGFSIGVGKATNRYYQKFDAHRTWEHGFYRG